MAHDLGEGAGRPRSWACLDIGAFEANIGQARSSAPGGRLLVVMKGDAYGHGAIHLAAPAVQAGAAMIGVGDSSEALELRAAGITAPILILGDLVPSEMSAVVREGITPTVHSGGRLEQLEQEAARQEKIVPVHLKADTGMGRLGMLPSRLPAVARRARDSAHVELTGLMTHLAGHGMQGRAANAAQTKLFKQLVDALAADGIRPREIHYRSSTALNDLGAEAGSFDSMARAGALLYGFSPDNARKPPLGYRPVLSLHTQLVFLKDVPSGTPIGYDGAFVTRRATRLGVIPFGYHDGMRTSLESRGSALIRGRRVAVLGKISMDYTTLDISHAAGVSVGDEVTLIGIDGDAVLTVEEVAASAGTSPYDFLCGLGRRVVRVPVKSGVISA